MTEFSSLHARIQTLNQKTMEVVVDDFIDQLRKYDLKENLEHLEKYRRNLLQYCVLFTGSEHDRGGHWYKRLDTLLTGVGRLGPAMEIGDANYRKEAGIHKLLWPAVSRGDDKAVEMILQHADRHSVEMNLTEAIRLAEASPKPNSRIVELLLTAQATTPKHRDNDLRDLSPIFN